jgi:hypothetical protein
MKLFIFLLSVTTASFCLAAEKLPPGHPPVNAQSQNQSAAATQLPQTGKVKDVINVAQYTYLEVIQGQQSRWLAGPTVEVKKGDTVHFDDGVEMKDFHSNSLDRTFPSVFFVNTIVVGEAGK